MIEWKRAKEKHNFQCVPVFVCVKLTKSEQIIAHTHGLHLMLLLPLHFSFWLCIEQCGPSNNTATITMYPCKFVEKWEWHRVQRGIME